MDPLKFLSHEQLLTVFCENKTEISCFREPNTFLRMLRDKDLIPKEWYKKLIGIESNQQREDELYELLDWLETEKPDSIELFWRCAFAPLIMQRYPLFHQLKETMLKGNQDTLKETDKKRKEAAGNVSGKKSRKKRSKIMEEEEEEEEEPEVEEEEEEEDEDEDDDDDDDDDDDYGPGLCTRSRTRKRRQQSPSDMLRHQGSPIKKGVKEDVRKSTNRKTQLPVTCGDKKGKLDSDKMAKGKACIFSEGRWFTPSDFEKFGGKESSRKWKQSICYQNTPLEKLLKEGHLKWQPFKPSRSLNIQRKKRRITSSRARRREHTDSESDSDFEVEPVLEDSDTDTEEEQEGDEEEEENREGEGGKNEDSEEAGDGIDEVVPGCYSQHLAVTCGSANGTLYKHRFRSGSSGKCIRTATRWLTPKEFSKVDKTQANSYWKSSILVLEDPLGDLIKRNVLMLHTPDCTCKICSKDRSTHLDEQEKDHFCSACGEGGSLLCCDQCPRAFHQRCHIPTVEENTLGEQWLCTFCVLKENQRWSYVCERSRTQAMDCRVSDFLLVPRYSNFIKNPMWLDKIAEKLQNKQYSTVGQFCSDVDLIFKNCAKFNGDNEFGQMGTRLKQLFQKKFQQVFGVKS